MDFMGAEWIYNDDYTNADNGCVYFYKDFTVSKEVKSAYISAASTDAFRIFLNDKRINENYFENRGSVSIRQIMLYRYDIKNIISENNSLYVILSSLKRKKHCSDLLFYAVITVEYADGKTEKIISDGSWDTSFGKIRTASFQYGEKTDFSTDVYERKKAHVNNDKKGYTYLLTEDNAPVLMKEPLPFPKYSVKGNSKIYDIGALISGCVSVKLKGAKNKKIKIRYSETTEFSDAFSDEIILSGKTDFFENEFIYKKFRYVEVPSDVELLKFEVFKISYNITRNGDFYCSNSKINEAYIECVKQCGEGFYDYKSMLEDMDDDFSFGMFSYNCREYTEAALKACRCVQAENGCIPIVSPQTGELKYGVFKNATFAPLYLLYRHYVMFGDIGVVKKNLNMCRGIMDFADRFSDSGDLEFVLRLLRAAEMMSLLCEACGNPDGMYYEKYYKSLKASFTDTLKLPELSADELAMLYEYRVLNPVELKTYVLNYSYKDVSREYVSSWLGLLYESGKFEEPYKIITSGDFDKRLCAKWIYSGCLGIKPDETCGGAGFKKVIIQPAIDLSYTVKKASGGYVTPYGKISVFWEKSDDMYTCCVTVPYEIDATCRFNGFKVVNQKSSRETYVFLLKKI